MRSARGRPCAAWRAWAHAAGVLIGLLGAVGGAAAQPAPGDAASPDAAPAPASAEVAAPSPVADEPAAPDDCAGDVLVLRMDDVPVNAGLAEWLSGALRDAEQRRACAVAVQLDTPGGALDATHGMVKELLASPVPVVVWVGPAGSRAGSAGTFLTLAAHVAAMAPTTTIGAAHPVSMAPGDAQDDNAAILLEKVTNDTAALARDLAARRGRDADFAERAVRESASLGADEAHARGVVDLLAPSLDAALAAAHGRRVVVARGGADVPVLLRADGPRVEVAPSARQRVLLVLGSPDVLFVLLSLGMMGLVIEFNHPGLIVPGAVGLGLLLLAAVGTAVVPVSWSAAALVAAGFALLVAEAFLSTWGLLGLLGAGAIALGGLLLVDATPAFDLRVSPALPLGVALTAGALTVAVATLAASTLRRAPQGGAEGMRGLVGEVSAPLPGLGGEGWVVVRGERWRARAACAVPRGHRVRVEDVDGLTLRVVPHEEVP